jgi:hypothetical protein
VKVFIGAWTFEVEASWEWITGEWNSEEILRQSQEGSQRPGLIITREHHYTQFSHTVTVTKRVTIGMFEKVPLLFYGKLELSSHLKKFVLILAKCRLPETQPFGVLRDIHSVIITKRRSKSITTMDTFQVTCAGYLQLTVAKWPPMITAPFACSLLRDHAPIVAGILMDTTWRVIQLSVTSILTAAVGNAGIPIARNFGLGELLNCMMGLTWFSTVYSILTYQHALLNRTNGRLFGPYARSMEIST